MAHFAIVGLDHQTGQNVSTVIEARSEDDAQETALRMGITVHEFKPLHPLAGAAAVQMARSDPHDRFNQHPAYIDPATGQAPETGHPTAPTPPPPPGHVPQHPLTAHTAQPATARQPESNTSVGSIAVLLILGVICGLAYLTVIQGGGAQQVMAMIAPAPVEVEAAFDVTEPLDDYLNQLEGMEDLDMIPVQTLAKNVDEQAPAEPTKLRLEATIPPTASGKAHGLRGSAVIGGQIVTPGQSVAGYRLIQVRDGMVLLEKDGKIMALRIAPNS
ncbi:hypothetical protein [Algisphaera agarilytica]|uniref:Type II secretion system protein B n=1 Tax=Algisphaera agarilytica TaxID=1385975 RepID=A0A7X0H6T5_9BACT|nr:hypothetical protein [Algisphaera agarilytica]MBB6430294.1 hypothetical protein [Algisphaera agarilytica]